jgi:hypothetical protein
VPGVLSGTAAFKNGGASGLVLLNEHLKALLFIQGKGGTA